MSGLRRVTDAVVHRRGEEPSQARKSPGLTNFDPIVLERGRTHDEEFERWANLVYDIASGGPALSRFRKDILIQLLNEAGVLVVSFRVYRCWPAEYVALSELDARASATSFEVLVLEHEGWERDREVTEPDEGSSSAGGGSSAQARSADEVDGIGEERSGKLGRAGFGSLDALAAADPELVASTLGVSSARAQSFVAEARRLLR